MLRLSAWAIEQVQQDVNSQPWAISCYILSQLGHDLGHIVFCLLQHDTCTKPVLQHMRLLDASSTHMQPSPEAVPWGGTRSRPE